MFNKKKILICGETNAFLRDQVQPALGTLFPGFKADRYLYFAGTNGACNIAESGDVVIAFHSSELGAEPLQGLWFDIAYIYPGVSEDVILEAKIRSKLVLMVVSNVQ